MMENTTKEDDSKFCENLAVPENAKAHCCEVVHKQNDKNTKVLMAMMIGRSPEEDVEHYHLLPSFKAYKGYAKEIKPELKHSKEHPACSIHIYVYDHRKTSHCHSHIRGK